MLKEKCNIGKSFAEFMKRKSEYEYGECYNNAFSVVAYNCPFALGVIGYVLSELDGEKVAVRHAWARFPEGNIIVDVTAFADFFPVTTIKSWDYVFVREVSALEWYEYTASHNKCPCIDMNDIPIEQKIREQIIADGYKILDD